MSTATNAVTAPVAGGALGTLLVWVGEALVFHQDIPLGVEGAVLILCTLAMGFVIRPEQGP